MCKIFTKDNIEGLAALISIGTPIVLLYWFLHSQKQKLSREYFDELKGEYAGYTEPASEPIYLGGFQSALLLKVLDIDGNGFFRGDFEFNETEYNGDEQVRVLRIEGSHIFFGRIHYTPYKKVGGNPYKPNENRTYTGTMHIVDRLDFLFDKHSIENYMIAEFSVKHFREMKTLKFELIKNLRGEMPLSIPEKFTLYKTIGLEFEPYNTIKSLFPKRLNT